MFACSASGEKLESLVIGNFENLRCIKKRETVFSTSTKNNCSIKTWINNYIFLKCFSTWHRKRGIVLFLDKTSSHGNELELFNVCLKFLPANIASHLQPQDREIIRVFKSLYLKHLLRSLLSKIYSSESSIFTTLYTEIKASTIGKCFQSYGFVLDSQEEEEEIYKDDNILLKVLKPQIAMNENEMVLMNADVPTEDASKELEMNLVKCASCLT